MADITPARKILTSVGLSGLTEPDLRLESLTYFLTAEIAAVRDARTT
jgi:hypothetical protein